RNHLLNRARPTNGSDRGSLCSHDLTLFVRDKSPFVREYMTSSSRFTEYTNSLLDDPSTKVRLGFILGGSDSQLEYIENNDPDADLRSLAADKRSKG
ncbi:MAG: hypothetical protein R8M45_05185, partial [Ghiorsea sp.]